MEPDSDGVSGGDSDSNGSEELAAEGKSICSETVGQESEMADTDEALWQYVQEEAPQELDGVKRHNA